MPDENLNGSLSGTGTIPETPVSSPAPAETPISTPSVPATTAPSEPAALTVRDAVRNFGLDLSQFQDDHSALQHMALAYQQMQQAQPYAQLYARHQQQFESWMRQQQQEALQKQQAQPQSWWKAPEFDPSWRQKLTRDPATGKLVPGEGASLDLPQKYQAWVEHQQQFFDKFAQNPIEAIRPGIVEVAQQVARQAIQQAMGGYQEQVFANNYVETNSRWLHQHDQNGQPLRDQNGQKILSPEGARFRDYVMALEQRGIRDVGMQQQIAQSMVERDVMWARMAQGGQQTQQQQANQQFLQANNRPGAGAAVDAQAQQFTGSNKLLNMMRHNLAAAGHNDQTVMAGLSA